MEHEIQYVSGWYNYWENCVTLLYYDEDDNRKYHKIKKYNDFFVKENDLNKINNIAAFYRQVEAVKKEHSDYLRISVHPDKKNSVLDRLAYHYGITVYEADLNPVKRYIADTDIKISSKYKYNFFDLETEDETYGFDQKEEMMILSCAFVDYLGKEEYFVSKDMTLNGEYDLLSRIANELDKYDQLLAWNGDNFDFPVLRARFDRHNIKFPWKTKNCLDYMEVYKKYSGRDDVKTSNALDAVGENVLGMRKIERGKEDTIVSLFNNNPEKLREYNKRDVEIMYELEKSKGFLKLHNNLASTANCFPDKSSLYATTLADGFNIRFGRKLGYIYPTRPKFDPEKEKSKDKFSGGYVKEPKVRMYDNVVVVDFSGMYPSIMISWGMSPDTVLLASKNYKRCPKCNSIGIYPRYSCESCGQSVINEPFVHKDGSVIKASVSTTGVHFDLSKSGVIVEALKVLGDMRENVKNLAKKEIKGSDRYIDLTNESTSIKVLRNSFYGIMGDQNSRYYVREIAESITSAARHLILFSIEYFEKNGFEVVYSDTDSVFINSTVDKVQPYLDKLNDELFIEELKRHNCKEYVMELSYEKTYSPIFFLAKKRYGGYVIDMEGYPPSKPLRLQRVIDKLINEGLLNKEEKEGTVDIKGLEFIRSDQMDMTRMLQEAVIVKILRDGTTDIDKIIRYISKYRDMFVNKTANIEDLLLRKGLSKDIEEYDQNNLPVQVRIAKILRDRGREVYKGMKIEYIVTDGKASPKVAIPVEDFDGTYDIFYYWNDKIFKPSERVLNVCIPNVEFKDLRLARSRARSQELQYSLLTNFLLENNNMPVFEE